MLDLINVFFEIYKKDVKCFKKVYMVGDVDVLVCVCVYVIKDKVLKYVDFLYVIVCEVGYESWLCLKFVF